MGRLNWESTALIPWSLPHLNIENLILKFTKDKSEKMC